MTSPRFIKSFMLINGLVPGALLGWDALHHNLGANPVNFAIRTTGLLALIFLILSLVVTPAARVSGYLTLIAGRRVLGLYAFFYTLSHFGIYFWWDRLHSIEATYEEIRARVYLQIGFAALLMMTPLAITSTGGMIRRLGSKRWKWLHRLAYPAAIGGAIHYYLQVKSDTTQPLIFGGVLAALLAYRWVDTFVTLGEKPLAATAAKPKFWTGRLKVDRIVDETPDVRTFRLAAVAGGKLPFDYMPGQYLNLALSIDGKRVKRSYTIASSPTQPGYCELTVKRDGVASTYLHERVRPGDTLDVSAPAGRFTFDQADGDSLVMIAGGVGITPLMTKIRYLTDTAWPGQLHLIYAVKTEADVIFRAELERRAARHPNLHVTITLTRAAGVGRRGRVTAELIREVVPGFARHVYHLCGPGAMLEATRDSLREIGVPDARIKFESFAAPSRADPTSDDTADPIEPAAASTIVFALNGQTADAPPGKPILEIAEDLGIDIPYDCRAGTCGTCKVKLLRGRVTMETQGALSKTDHAANVILACQAVPRGAVTVNA